MALKSGIEFQCRFFYGVIINSCFFDIFSPNNCLILNIIPIIGILDYIKTKCNEKTKKLWESTIQKRNEICCRRVSSM